MTISQVIQIVHSTSKCAFDNIIKHKKLFNQIDRKKLSIIFLGKGKHGRKIGPSDIFDKNFDDSFEEALGVYFRIGTKKKPINFFDSEIQLHFSPKLLINYPAFILNTEENFGFLINKHGEKGISRSGKEGVSFVGKIDQDISDIIIPERTELVIPSSVDLKYLEKIIFKNIKMMKFFQKKIDKPYEIYEKKLIYRI